MRPASDEERAEKDLADEEQRAAAAAADDQPQLPPKPKPKPEPRKEPIPAPTPRPPTPPEPEPEPELELEPARECPAGYDPDKARRTANAVANNIRNKGYDYDRRVLQEWQRWAGIVPDKIYGGGTRGAFLFFGVTDPPRPLFKPTTTQPYEAPC